MGGGLPCGWGCIVGGVAMWAGLYYRWSWNKRIWHYLYRNKDNGGGGFMLLDLNLVREGFLCTCTHSG